MTSRPDRPLSPHLGIYTWGPHMLVSILHRITGAGLTLAGLAILTWWLMALSGDKEGYELFAFAAGHPVGLVILFGLVWAFWQHLFSGLRHLVLDIGAGYELKTNKFWAVMTIIAAAVMTLVTFFLFMGGVE
ncbi:succinate dehydrogenase, cytochrome b556 subunit [Sphingomicrobium lutaoense]|uniref:Succinate dehydrogenase cytochrome b556 subunit n=1 Tax=Sphingomicrobium lutaoense TaxID=515949 RepID=A0A839Z6W0_9SPHN|nr:succinate dehydrogenase, cytochrome b556 subunit [Sphingomicrobium lutaoense]MBB3764484.1 succinate dehydrogenase / fumarate reductase cytochrome b subunit [Sphingomicrobium lutaoense]